MLLYSWHCFSSEKIIVSESGEKYAQIKQRLQVKTVQDSIKQVDFDVRGQQGKYFFTGGSIMDSVLVRIECLKLKCLNDGFVS